MAMRTNLLPLLPLLAATAIACAAERSLTFDLGHGAKLELLLIPRGTFQQGSPPTEPKRGEDEERAQGGRPDPERFAGAAGREFLGGHAFTVPARAAR